MTRACSDCGISISQRSSGRCRSCALAAVNRLPEMRARSSAQMSRMNTESAFRAKGLAVRSRRPEWCPKEYAALNRKMEREGFDDDERQRIIAADIATRWRRVQAMAA